MCGLLFVKHLRPLAHRERFLDVFKKALSLMSYRGPDAYEYFQVGSCFFGHVRLAILDLSSASLQPFKTNNGVLLFNGEIYNFKALNSRVASDTLMLAQLFEEGRFDVNQLSGMYALLFYNELQDQVEIYRDFFGEKPLYYYQDESVFIAASTIKAIKYILKESYGINLALNEAALVDYLGFGFVREPQTIYQNVYVLLSGHGLFLNKNHELKRVSHVKALAGKTALGLDAYMSDAILSTDVEPTLLLSGGIDSTYLLHEFHQLKIAPNILIYQHKESKSDEAPLALAHLKKIDQELLQKTYVIKDHFNHFDFEAFAKVMEQPSSDGMNLFNILRGFRKQDLGAKLVYTGLGGDELFGGYNSFKYLAYFKYLRYLSYVHLEKFLGPKFGRFFLSLGQDVPYAILFYFLYRLDLNTLNACGVSLDQLQDCFTRFVNSMQVYLGEETRPLLSLKICETMDYMKNQLLRDNDNIAMHFGFESRSPLLDRGLMNMPPDFKAGLKDTLSRCYTLTFPAKKGFSVNTEFIDHADILDDFKTFFSHAPKIPLTPNGLKKLRNLLLWAKFDAKN